MAKTGTSAKLKAAYEKAKPPRSMPQRTNAVILRELAQKAIAKAAK